MGSVVLSDILACFLAVFLLLSGPLYTTYQNIDFVSESRAKNAVSYFQKEVRKNGYVDAKTYNNFLNQLNSSGKIYKINLTHTSKLVYPDNNGDFKVYNIEYGNNQIFDKIKTGKYVMKYGDDFKVQITETEVSQSRILANAFSKNGSNIKQTYFGGGMIENEVEG